MFSQLVIRGHRTKKTPWSLASVGLSLSYRGLPMSYSGLPGSDRDGYVAVLNGGESWTPRPVPRPWLDALAAEVARPFVETARALDAIGIEFKRSVGPPEGPDIMLMVQVWQWAQRGKTQRIWTVQYPGAGGPPISVWAQVPWNNDGAVYGADKAQSEQDAVRICGGLLADFLVLEDHVDGA